MEGRYLYESFSSDPNKFDTMFTEYVNKKYSDGWKYKECQFVTEGGKRLAHCIFKRV